VFPRNGSRFLAKYIKHAGEDLRKASKTRRRWSVVQHVAGTIRLDKVIGMKPRISNAVVGLRVEFLLKTESGYLRDAEVT